MRIRNFISMLVLSLLFAGIVSAQGVSPESAAKYTEGQGLYEKRRYAEAVKAFEDAVKLDGKNAQAYRALGSAYQKQRNIDKAVEAYKMAITVKSDYASAYFELGQLQATAQKKFDAAQASFKKVIEIDPNFESGKAKENLQKMYLAQGTVYFKSKNYSKAATEYENAAQLDPTDVSAFYNLGLAQKAARNYSAAENAFSTAVDLDNTYGKAHRALGDLYRDTGKNSDAASAYLKAIQADPKDTDSRLKLAIVYMDMKQNGKAIATLQQAVEIDTKNSELYNALGKAYAEEKQFKNAIDAYTRAIAIKNNAEYHYRSASAYLELKQYQNGIASAQKAVTDPKWRVPANVVMGDCYRDLGQKEKAMEHYRLGAGDRIYKKYCEDQIERIKNPAGTSETSADTQ